LPSKQPYHIYLKLRRRVLSYYFRILAILFLASNPLKAVGNLTPDDVKDLFPQPSHALIKIQPLNKSGSNTQSISQVIVEKEGEKRYFICKELKERKELKNLTTLEPFVVEYETSKKSQPNVFPPKYLSLARFRGSLSKKERDFVLFDEASGQSVFNLMIEWTQKGYDWAGLEPSDIKNHLSYAFSNVGRAIASFHLRHGEFDEATSTFKSITHGDLHTSNVFYNLWSNETTLIDYETMATSRKTIFYDVNRLLEFSRGETESLVREKAAEGFFKSYGSLFLDKNAQEHQATYIKKRLTILDDFFSALKQGYIQIFKDAGYVVDINKQLVTRGPRSLE
ncbi:MAG: hypothetical protein ACD_16C00166G0001, partial [uncultured bacterium]